MKHDLYIKRIKEDNTIKIASEIRKFQSFYQIYILHNQNEKQKAMINVLEAQFEEEHALRK
jgi:rhamnose utilization protein RhaD (predicted bifunctional aldolase and dehydrogenase)